jgi:peptidoglycan/xylan/chitin deacetylase (PgdA/CDA1 family)
MCLIGCSGAGKKYIKTNNAEKALLPSGTAMMPIPDIIKDTATPTNIHQSSNFKPTYTYVNTDFPDPTVTSSLTETSYPTDTPNPTETPTFEWIAAGNVTSPILLYHHISDDDPENRYYVTLEDFRNQMETLLAWGYSTITAADLANFIIEGGVRLNRPVVITFDDGFVDIFLNAFPIMKAMGFIGTIYIYVDHVGSRGYLDAGQITTLAESGWEIGNHSMSHANLTQNHSKLEYEVEQSRTILEKMIGVNVNTFAYPYGEFDDFVIEYLRNSGYLAGMGLGLNYDHSIDSLYQLTRIEVQNDYSLSEFASLLPWSEQ